MNKSEINPVFLAFSSPIILSVENINFCVGLPLNIFVVFHLLRAGGLDGCLFFTLNQSASEILFAIPAPLFILCYVNFENLCFYYPIMFIISTCMMARFLFQCCVCFERYMAVIHPVTFLKYKALKYRLAISALSWIYSIISGTMGMLKLLELPSTAFAIANAIILSGMIFCTFSLLRGLMRPGPGARGRDDGGVSAARRRAFKIVCLNLLIFFIQTMPVMVCFGISVSLPVEVFAQAFVIAFNISISVSLFQPVLFLYQNGKLTCGRRS